MFTSATTKLSPLAFEHRANGSNTRPQLTAPTSKLVDKLVAKGISKQGGKPTNWGHMFPFEVHQIVRHYYTMWKGISNYYSFADNNVKLSRIHYILKYSCVLTLALKLKLGTAKKVFKKYGKDLIIIVNNKVVASFPQESFVRPNKFHKSAITNLNPLLRLTKLSNSTIRTSTSLANEQRGNALASEHQGNDARLSYDYHCK